MDTAGGRGSGREAAGDGDGVPAPCEQCGRPLTAAATIDRVWLQHRLRCAEGAKLMRDLLRRWRESAARRRQPRD